MDQSSKSKGHVNELICKIKNQIVYDIIYDPKYAELLERANKLTSINGLRMNMIQAVLTYGYTNDTALSKGYFESCLNESDFGNVNFIV